MPSSATPVRCPCGSGERYADCCGPLHAGEAVAETAERLMRSRFSAFAVGDDAYVLETWHPSTRPAALDDPGSLEWLQLEVLGATAGGPDDARGTVEFIAYFWDSATRERGQLHEHSAFRRSGGRWRYVGEVA